MAVSPAMPPPSRLAAGPLKMAAGLRKLVTVLMLTVAAPGYGAQAAHLSHRYAHVRMGGQVRMVMPAAKPSHLPHPKPHPLPTAAALYQHSLQADDLFSYRGRQTTTYWRTGHTVAVLVAHRAPGLRRIDYIAPDAQRGRSLVTDERQEWQFDPRTNILRHRLLAANADAVEDAAQSYDLLRTNYVLQVQTQTKEVADRKAYILTMTRKANRALARKLWIDVSTGLAIKRENYREDGKLVLTVSYTDINFRVPLPRSLFDLAPLAHRPGVRLVEEKPVVEKVLPLNTVSRQWRGSAIAPPVLAGYRLVSAGMSSNGAKPILHLRYSDGLSLVSLFEQPRTQTRKPTRVPTSMRPVSIGRSAGHVSRRASLTAFNWDQGSLNITLVGELVEPTLLTLAVAAEQTKPAFAR